MRLAFALLLCCGQLERARCGSPATTTVANRSPVAATTTVAKRRNEQRGSLATAMVTRRPFSTQRDTPVKTALLASNTIAFFALLKSPAAFNALAKNNAMIRRGGVHRMVTSCMLHGSIPHLYLNMMSLNNLGNAVEPWFGSRRMAFIYVASGISGNALSLALNRAPLSVGASGCIFGLLGAYMAFLDHNRAFFSARGRQVGYSIRSMLDTCVLTAAVGLMPGSRIDNLGHLGGLTCGWVCGYMVGPKLVPSKTGPFIVDKPLVQLPPLLGGGPRAQKKRQQQRLGVR